tara:strand:- start:12095 stop:12358 length:264 start_codon:yes stop_codon:yes gene_type:complete
MRCKRADNKGNNRSCSDQDNEFVLALWDSTGLPLLGFVGSIVKIEAESIQGLPVSSQHQRRQAEIKIVRIISNSRLIDVYLIARLTV